MMHRRAFIGSAAVALAAKAAPKWSLTVFSKHLQWAPGYNEMAEFAAEAGFDGVDLTVRTGGHVLPERVASDLPRAVDAVRKAGLQVPMITAGIVDAESPHAEEILRTASGLGIPYYRWGNLKYREDQPIASQLEAMKPRVRALAALNERHRITAMYHTHSGMEVGAPIWDVWELLRDVDPRWTGINYDVGHATVEGGYGGWIRSFQLIGRHMRGVALKDFVWGKEGRGEWRPQWCPPGDGMVDFPHFFRMLRQANFDGPVQVHFEYAGLGGAAEGKRNLTISKSELLARFRRDAQFYRDQVARLS